MNGTATAVVLALAWFAVTNALASCLAWTLIVSLGTERLARRPAPLLALRLLPAATSALFVLAVFLPAHWRFEPRGIDESFGVSVYALAGVGALLLLRSIGRAALVARAGWTLRACARLPRIRSSVGGSLDVYEVNGLSGVSLAGVVHQRILVGPAVRQALTEAELDAAVAHEMAHRAARDNVKRFVMFCAPDLFGGSRAGRQLEEQWRAAAEWQADSRAVRGDESRAIHLASALVKVARIATGPSQWTTSPAWSTLHEAPLLETRVRRLVEGKAASVRPPRAAAAAGVLLGLVALVVAAGVQAAGDVHDFTETLAHLLP
jgi:hypothetical protein